MASKKPDIKKNLNRRFFRLFNDKSLAKKATFWGLLTLAPAVYITEQIETDPSDIRAVPTAAAADVIAFEREIDAIKLSLPAPLTQQLTPQQIEKTLETRELAKDFSVRVLNNANISEKDVGYLATVYRDALGKEIPLQNFENMRYSNAFIDECKSSEKIKGLAPELAANEIMTCTASDAKTEFWTYSIGVYMALLIGFETMTKTLLRAGRRRDDENIVEEKKEKFIEATEDLREFLKPKPPVRKM